MTVSDEVVEFLRESNAIEDVRDEQSLADAIAAWERMIESDLISIPVVLEVHGILMRNQPIVEKYKGMFRDISVNVSGRICIPYRLVLTTMLNWANTIMYGERELDVWERHILFEKIHPFVDGNGRMGRILHNWILVKRLKKPITVFREKDKEEYYKLFK